MSWCGAISMSWIVQSRRLSKSSKSEAKSTGKGIAKEKPSKHWTNTMIWNSYWSPYPCELRLTKVDGIHFCWDEQKKRSDHRVNDYKLCTVQGKPVAQSRSSS